MRALSYNKEIHGGSSRPRKRTYCLCSNTTFGTRRIDSYSPKRKKRTFRGSTRRAETSQRTEIPPPPRREERGIGRILRFLQRSRFPPCWFGCECQPRDARHRRRTSRGRRGRTVPSEKKLPGLDVQLSYGPPDEPESPSRDARDDEEVRSEPFTNPACWQLRGRSPPKSDLIELWFTVRRVLSAILVFSCVLCMFAGIGLYCLIKR